MTILPLGTNGFFSSFGRHTACYLLLYGDTLIILDAGSGLFRLAEPEGKKFLKSAKKIHLYLSHYHLDHTFGFYAAFKLLAGNEVTVLGKGKRKVFSELTKLDYFPIDFEEKYGHYRWKKLEEGNHKIDDYQVAVRRQHHRGHGSLAFKFTLQAMSSASISAAASASKPPRMLARQRPRLLRGETLIAFGNTQPKPKSLLRGVRMHSSPCLPAGRDGRTAGKEGSHNFPEEKLTTLAYVTDSEPTDESVEFVKDADLLLHEHGNLGKKYGQSENTFEKYDTDDGHVTTIGAALIAKEAGVKKLALIHHNPFTTTKRLKTKHLVMAQSIFPKTILAHDLQSISW